MVGLLITLTPDRVIDRAGEPPRRYTQALARQTQMVRDGVVVVGRRTYERYPIIGEAHSTIVLTHEYATMGGDPWFAPNVETALRLALGVSMVWVAGGLSVFRAALEADLVDLIDVTWVPDVIEANDPAVTIFQSLDTWHPIETIEDLGMGVTAQRFVRP